MSQIVQLAELATDYVFNPPLPYFVQVKLSNENGVLLTTPITGKGSGDFTNLGLADGFLELPENQTNFKIGEEYPYITFR